MFFHLYSPFFFPSSSFSLQTSLLRQKIMHGFHNKQEILHILHFLRSEFLHIWFHLKHPFKKQKILSQNTFHACCTAWIPAPLYAQPTSAVCSHDCQKPLIRYHGNTCASHIFDFFFFQIINYASSHNNKYI